MAIPAPPVSANPQLTTTEAITPAPTTPSSPQSYDSTKKEGEYVQQDGQITYGYGSTNSSEDELYAKWYEPPDSYESKHRWDPKATWTTEEETKLRRRLDLKVAFVACICFAALQLDRGNITNALSDNLLTDVGMTTKEYNNGMTIFYLCFLSAELPSQMISKKLGSDVWIPIQMMLWSVVAIAQVGITGRSSFYATRALLGLLEGGFIADTILYLSYYYTAAELTLRLSFFWISYTATNVIGALLAAGLLRLRGHHGLPGWKWLFLIEGVLTFAIGAWAFFYLPASPTQTKKWWRPKGWFTEREETIIVNKVLRDDPTKSSMHNREGLSLVDLWRSLTDFDMWPLYLIGLVAFITPSTVQAYFTLTLKQLKYTTLQTNLLTTPSWILFAIGNFSCAYGAKKLNSRLLFVLVQPIWHLVFMIVLVVLPDHTNRWAKYVLLTLVQGYPYCHPILVSMNSMNAGSVRTRTVASSLYNMFVQAASLVASNIYQPSDSPYYHKGNRVLSGLSAASIVLVLFAKAWYIYRNKQKSKIWDNYTTAEKEDYLANTTDKGNKR
nr:uncharacterized protein I303_02290 [Kwoniella dejecticola CBS 10117]OBR88071.1 hypothetical protein I303_02290 [Kwoniella dejecticola CBS 10117]